MASKRKTSKNRNNKNNNNNNKNNNNNNNNSNNNYGSNVRVIDLTPVVNRMRAHGVGNRSRFNANDPNNWYQANTTRTPPRYTRKAKPNAPKKRRASHSRRH